MDDQSKKIRMTLEQSGLFSDEECRILAGYNINTLEQLLGATNGLSNTAIFQEFKQGDKTLDKLKQFIGKDTLVKFQAKEPKYPTGLIINDD